MKKILLSFIIISAYTAFISQRTGHFNSPGSRNFKWKPVRDTLYHDTYHPWKFRGM